MEGNNVVNNAPLVQGQLVQPNTVVGQPVGIAPGMDGLVPGPFFDQNYFHSMISTGQWTDGMTDCVCSQDSWLAVCCPCLSVYKTLQKVGEVQAPDGARTKFGAMQFLMAYLVIAIGGQMVSGFGPTYHCVDVPDEPEKMAASSPNFNNAGFGGTSGSSNRNDFGHDFGRRLDIGQDIGQDFGSTASQMAESAHDFGRRLFASHRTTSGGTHQQCRSVVTLIVEVLLWGLVAVACRGIRNKLMVREDEGMTVVKAGCCMEICLCVQPCFLAQMARHVDRVLGYDPMGHYMSQPLQGVAPGGAYPQQQQGAAYDAQGNVIQGMPSAPPPQ